MASLTWEEKIEKAKETAIKNAEKKGVDETVKQQMIDEAVQKVLDAKEKAEAQPKGFIVEVAGNPAYCGIGAGGVQFANGEAHITSERMAEWFREHDGYKVTEA